MADATKAQVEIPPLPNGLESVVLNAIGFTPTITGDSKSVKASSVVEQSNPDRLLASLTIRRHKGLGLGSGTDPSVVVMSSIL
jgi:hypothetical protein